MPWKLNPYCFNCGEEKKLHIGTQKICRFEHPDGWIDAKMSLPPMRRTVIGRRGHEVFLVRRIEADSLFHPGGWEWVVPCQRPDYNDGQPYNGCVTGVTHWREARVIEGRTQSRGPVT